MYATTVNLSTAVALLRSIVERFGFDHTADDGAGQGCTYFNRNGLRLTPVCIVGQVFADLGILRALSSGEYGQFGSCKFGAGNDGGLIRESAREFGVEFTDDAFLLMQAAQHMQDTGSVARVDDSWPLGYTGNVSKSWGDALDYAVWVVQQDALAQFKKSSPAFMLDA